MNVNDHRIKRENSIEDQYSKEADNFEGSEVIEELIEIEESGEEMSAENRSVTVNTNLAGGRGSIGSVVDENGS